ncbi:MAG: class I adenylate-forming enzyme family protein [Burkholderiaceae bacterium]
MTDDRAPLDWRDCLAQGALPPMRDELHHGSRVVRCFRERPRSVHALLERALARHAQADALIDGDRRLSYAALDEQVGRLAAGLQALGVRRGDRVVLMAGNRIEFVSAFFALQRLRAIAVPLSTREQADGLAYVVGQCGAAAVIVDDELAERAQALSAASAARPAPWVIRLPALQAPAVSDTGARASDFAPSPRTIAWRSLFEAGSLDTGVDGVEDDTAVLLYTSGTTGRPKGAMLSHLGIAHSVEHFRVCMGLGEGARIALAVPASHVTGLVAIIATALHCAGAVIVVREFKAPAFLALAARERMQATILVPAMYRLCLMQPEFDSHDLSPWRVGGYGGAPMPEATIDELARRLPALALMNAYGATETTSPATVMPAALTRDNLDSVGLTVPCGEIRIMDDDGRELPPGETGEIWIAGPMVVAGYWNNPEATAREFSGGYWRSGDLGSRDARGFVRVFDRKKDMINRGGYKIFSIEVENLLMAQPGVLEAAVLGRPCPVLGERVHAVVTVASAGVDPAALRAACAASLADYKVPETIDLRSDPLPRNANGKVLKRQLRDAIVDEAG